MRKISLYIIAGVTAAIFTGCGTPADNKPAANANANAANANTAKPVAAAPTADALLALDKAATEAWMKGDSKYFDGLLTDKFVSYEGGQRMGKADLIKMVAESKCEVKDMKLDEPQMTMIDADTYVLTYKDTVDGTCKGADGKDQKVPSPTRAASVWVRSGDKWQGVFHGENLIIDPKNPPKAPPAPPKKPEAKKDDKMAANSNANAAPAPATTKPVADPNTEALTKIHLSGWEAFKAKDAKKFDEITAANLVIVDPLGTVYNGKANVIKQWTETMKCEGVTKVSVTDGFASAISPTVELFTLKGTADGTCDGQKNGPLYQSTIYVKEGDAWKLAFMLESPGM